ncbi:unnamed protein product [Gordionus sp. m RMFG-2023]
MFQILFTFIVVWLITYGLIPVVKLWQCGCKHPIPIPFFGTMLWIYINGFQKCYIEWNRKYGQFYAATRGHDLIYMVSDPIYLKEILVKSFSNFHNRRMFPLFNKYFGKSVFVTRDEQWRVTRKLILPTFTSHKMKTDMFPLVIKCASKMVGYLKDSLSNDPSTIAKRSDEGDDYKEGSIAVVNTKDIFGCYTMDTIASTAFGLELDSHKEINHDFVRNARKVFEFNVTRPIFALIEIFPVIIPLVNYFKLSIIEDSTANFFSGIVEDTIQKRQKFNIVRNDFLQLLVDSNKAYNLSHSNSNESQKANSCIYDNNGSKDLNTNKISDGITSQEDGGTEIKEGIDKETASTSGLSKEQYIANALFFFIAGYESTANALGWVARTLAWKPEVQETLRQEIKQKISQKRKLLNSDSTSISDIIDYEDVTNLKYMDQVIKEVMRLHPPITFFDRMAEEDYYLGDTLIKKGTVIVVPVYALHRDENIWASPNEFDPKRFDIDDT